ncbi:MAG: hypothetical protein GXP58_02315 [Deltaproteobacteria bacterium]|nr:hypothetical protein [Deltaproteobacteria bacterium]
MKKNSRRKDFLMLRSFGQELISTNHLDFVEWVLISGMLFGAEEEWWGEGRCRPLPHEGIDLALYRDCRGKTVSLKGRTRIPVAAAGEVVAVIKDFLGRSIFVHHVQYDEEDVRLFTLYGHTRPYPGVVPGCFLQAGEVMATLAEVRNPVPGLLPHLHLSVALIPRSISQEELCWERLTLRDDVVFIDPVELLEGRYIIES